MIVAKDGRQKAAAALRRRKALAVYPTAVELYLQNRLTLRTLRDAAGLSSTSVASVRVRELMTMGWVRQDEVGQYHVTGVELVKTDAVAERLEEAEAIW